MSLSLEDIAIALPHLRSADPVMRGMIDDVGTFTLRPEREESPTHVVCSWMGNSESVARKNYLQVTADHYDRAITMVQNRVRKTAERGGNAPNQQEQTLTINNAKTNKPRETRDLLITGAACASGAVAEEGLEPPTRGL